MKRIADEALRQRYAEDMHLAPSGRHVSYGIWMKRRMKRKRRRQMAKASRRANRRQR